VGKRHQHRRPGLQLAKVDLHCRATVF
jgi:hypothetical protein